MSVIDFEAAQKWNKVPKAIQQKLISNVFCSKCFVTKIVDYDMRSEDGGIVLEGKCKTCSQNVARFIEDSE